MRGRKGYIDISFVINARLIKKESPNEGTEMIPLFRMNKHQI